MYIFDWLKMRFNSVRCSGTVGHTIMMTNTEFVKKLYNLVNRPNYYNNHFPYNLCYYDGNKISADCWNLVKSLIWDPSIDQNYTVGRYAYPNFSTGLGDWTVGGMIDACYKADPTSVSTDFSNLSQIPAGALLYYYNGSHAGVYVGNGKVIESTTAWGGGILESEVLTDGTRIKNGATSGRWSKWARMPWIEYEEEPEPPEPEYKQWKKGDKVKLKADGYIYGTTSKFASWVYNSVVTVTEDSYKARTVIGNEAIPCIGACYSNDLTEFTGEEELEDDDIVPVDIIDSDEEEKDDELSVFEILLKFIKLILSIFSKK